MDNEIRAWLASTVQDALGPQDDCRLFRPTEETEDAALEQLEDWGCHQYPLQSALYN